MMLLGSLGQNSFIHFAHTVDWKIGADAALVY